MYQYTEEEIKKFTILNYKHCVDLCQAWGLKILTDGELLQAGEYLLNQI